MFGLSKDLAKLVESHSSLFWKVLKNSLRLTDEKILIISDYGKEGKQLSTMLAYGYYLAAKDKGLEVEICLQKTKKGFMSADDHVVKALNLLGSKSVIILTLSNKLGRFGDRKSFRGFCKEKGHRFISTTGLGDATSAHFELFLEAMVTNYTRMKKKGLALKKKLDRAKEVQIKTVAGTDVTFNVEGMEAIANIGDYQEPGTGGNIPAGEVYLPPQGYEGVNGVVVIDGSVRIEQGTLLLKSPLKLVIKKGRIINLEGEEAHLLEKSFQQSENRAKYPYRVRYIGELGIGINPGAVLMGSTIMDEKVLGTAHIGIGSNSWFGGVIKTIYHGDQVFKNPEIFLDGKRINL